MTQLDQTEDQAPFIVASDRDLPENLPAESTADPMPIGGGLPIIQYWAQKTLSPQGPQIWKTLFHKSACLSCAVSVPGSLKKI